MRTLKSAINTFTLQHLSFMYFNISTDRMEGGSADVAAATAAVGGGGSGAAGAGSRWNPTKEQINVLEGLYGQGMRTPSAEQIEQITGMLRPYGQIEGKNVFYWFQNHKARQRQKEKQQTLLAYTNFVKCGGFFPPSSIFPSFPHAHLRPPSNVVCGPCYQVPQSDLGFSQAQPKMAALSAGSTSTRKQVPPENKILVKAGTKHHRSDGGEDDEATDRAAGTETLPLFPLHPTGILEHGREALSCGSHATFSSESSSLSFEQVSSEQPPFNFFYSGSYGSGY